MNKQVESYPPHWHLEVEIIIVQEGQLRVRCFGIDYTLHEGDILIICPSVIHEIYKEERGVRYYILADLSSLTSFPEINTAFSLIIPAAQITKEEYGASYKKILAELNRALDIYFGNLRNYMDYQKFLELQETQRYQNLPFMAETQIYACLLNCLSETAVVCKRSMNATSNLAHVANKTLNQNRQTVRNACDYILSHFTVPLSLEDIAARSGFSKFHFEKIFKQFMNMSYYQYVTIVRLAYSQQLLANDSLTISEIALSSGFSSCTAFTRSFKQIVGFTPTDYRKLKQPRETHCLPKQ
ncbi:MAG: AraC family transcriptional regulator [Oribacterium sp.]|nr:AraC family transcriptional regulator [Oribacterium sp.]